MAHQLLCIIAGGLLALQAVGNMTARQPILSFDSFIWDFGNVQEGSTHKHTFRYINKSNTTVTITGIQPT